VTTGSAGQAPAGATVTGPNTRNDTDAAIAAEDRAIDRKVKSICKGC